MTLAIYRSIQVEAENAHQAKRRFSVSGVLSELDVSSSGYYDWAARKPSKQAQHRKKMKKKIQTIYDDSKQIYGAPKIAQVMHQNGDSISERTVGVYMRQMGIRACWIKHYTVANRNSDFDEALVNILQECFNPEGPDRVWCSDITYIWTAEGFVYLEPGLGGDGHILDKAYSMAGIDTHRDSLVDRFRKVGDAIWVFMVPRLALTLRTVGVNRSRSRMAASMTLLAMLFHLSFHHLPYLSASFSCYLPHFMLKCGR